ncbi:Transmembrane nucleoporin [Neocucurbitaria cava]|uniref:Transmembrane nucleoporin n=1 Tax=Neocucurbitaria cava TaxID=798079 RepID=A0A9W8Y3G8_9PLEO|nr:Transmembrane nucleoporin [Neocucurbitaria cava]
MAPPPPASLPLGQRLAALAQTLQFAWFTGHVALLLTTLRYSLSYITFNYNSKWAAFSYRVAFLSACVTYGIVVYKAYRARTRAGKQGGMLTLAADENVQYLIMALVWLFSRQIPLAVLPFAVYSIFHVATYVRSNLLPTIQPPPAATTAGSKPQGSAASEAIGRFVKEYYDGSMTLVALLEIALWFRVVGSALLFQKGSWILLVVYTVFFRARFAQSSFVQEAIGQVTSRIDAQLANQSTPPAARQAWGTFKNIIRQAADATDIRRYVGGQPGAAPKKAQ